MPYSIPPPSILHLPSSILVTGGAGFIGSNIVAELYGEGSVGRKAK
ncbi:MAG TPA: NAD-dependent epimerase/dehydratase family protein [Anaerolineae bacterium]|nr:NAD-dependent epimerase/dehydratase family protein [Anaerolineae bacterium]